MGNLKHYTGVGSRETPVDILELMTKIAFKLSEQGYTLRSGAAYGADIAFEDGATKKEIFLPWQNFQRHKSSYYLGNLSFEDLAERRAADIHPAWNRLTDGAKSLHTRNIYQVLGTHLSQPSNFLVCWAEVDKNGIPKGGTRTAWVLAEQCNAPCFNLIFDEHRERFEKFVN